MQFYRKFTVAEGHVGLLYEDEQFIRILKAGIYRISSLFKSHRVDMHYTQQASALAVPDSVLSLAQTYAEEIEVRLNRWQTGADQVGLVYMNDVLIDVLAPAQRGAYWINAQSIEVRLVNIAETGQVEPALARLLLGARNKQLRNSVANAVVTLSVAEGHVGFLYIDERYVGMLQSGIHAWWKFDRVVQGKQLDCRLQNMEVNGQEILTADKVSLRVNLSATWQVVDAAKVMESLADHQDFLYREFQLALRSIVSTRTLDQLLEDKNLLNAQVCELVAERADAFGLKVGSVGARDIVLPGEMKEILAQVVEAQKRAEANLIKRREETQATRSLHNTAKVMEGNATLLRLKELEVLEKVSGQIATLNVYGGLNGVMNDLITLTDSSIKNKP